jgi:hypothetical protein
MLVCTVASPRPAVGPGAGGGGETTVDTQVSETDMHVELRGGAGTRDHVASDEEARHDAATLALSHHGRRLNHLGTAVAAVVAVQDGHSVRLDALERSQVHAVAVGSTRPAPFPSFRG